MATIQFEQRFSMKNGNKITKKNWQKVIAKGTEPCTTVLGVPEIEKQKQSTGAYYETWKLVKEPEGYIFREINHNCGINGHHKTPKIAIWFAMSHRINVFLEA